MQPNFKLPFTQWLNTFLPGLGVGSLARAFSCRPHPRDKLQSPYQALIKEVGAGEIDIPARIVEVTSMDDLARLAMQKNMLILHIGLDAVHCYFVQTRDATYRHVTGNQSFAKTAARPEPQWSGNKSLGELVQHQVFKNMFRRG